MEHLPLYVYLTFGFTVLLAVALFYRASKYSRAFLVTVMLLVVIQAGLGLIGFYQPANSLPPRFPLLVAPSMVILLALVATSKGRLFLDSLDIKQLTIFHSLRVLVEVVLYWLFLYKAVPALLTFEGRNFDIVSGLSAPLVYYFGFIKKRLNRFVIVAWNLICMGLLASVVFYSICSAPSPFQQFGFDQPNIALAYFPFVLLPAILVPLVLLSHLATIRQLIKK